MSYLLQKWHKNLPVTIPGVVYRGYKRKTFGIICLAFALAGFFFPDKEFSTYATIFILLLAAAWGFVFSANNPIEVYIDQSKVRVLFEDSQKISRPLEGYFLQIFTVTRQPSTKNYSYSVNLIDKSCVEIDGEKPVPNQVTHKRASQIPLRARILTVNDLRDFINTVQERIEKPLDIIFSSEEVYEQYKSERGECF